LRLCSPENQPLLSTEDAPRLVVLICAGLPNALIRPGLIVQLGQQILHVIQMLLRNLQPFLQDRLQLRRSLTLEELQSFDDPHVPEQLRGKIAAIELRPFFRRKVTHHRLLNVSVDFLHDFGEVRGRSMLCGTGDRSAAHPAEALRVLIARLGGLRLKPLEPGSLSVLRVYLVLLLIRSIGIRPPKGRPSLYWLL
jgi:hypothetical protein